MKKIKYLIIGGGISGLSFAKNIKDNSFLIVEKDSSLGGLCRTHYNGEYIWDYAGHFFHFANPEIKKYFDERIDGTEIVTRVKDTKIYYKGNYIDFPFQKNIHQLPKDEFIECLYDLFFKEEAINSSDFESMLYSKFGKGITEKFLKPYNEKLYACSLKQLDTNSMGRFFPYADVVDIIKNMNKKKTDNVSYNTTFSYPKKGAQVFINTLISEIKKENYILNAEVANVDIDSKTIAVNNEAIEYEYLINTIPFNHFLKLCGNKNVDAYLTSNQVLVFNIGFDGPFNDIKSHWIYYPSKEYVFYRIGFYNNILQMQNGSVYVEIGFESNKELDKDIINDLYNRTIDDMRKCGIISDQKVIAHEALIINPGYVHITELGSEWVKDTMKILAKKGIYSIGRYGAWTYCSMEDCIIQSNELYSKLVCKS